MNVTILTAFKVFISFPSIAARAGLGADAQPADRRPNDPTLKPYDHPRYRTGNGSNACGLIPISLPATAGGALACRAHRPRLASALTHSLCALARCRDRIRLHSAR